MTHGQIEKEKVLGLKHNLTCFVVCSLIPGPEGTDIRVEAAYVCRL